MNQNTVTQWTNGTTPPDDSIRTNLPVQCTRCRNKHHESERIDVRNKKHGWIDSTCPRCGGKSYYDMTPYVAWCWVSGLIEFGTQAPKGSITIASGPKAYMKAEVDVRARHGKGEGRGQLLMPGVPEAESREQARKALATWLTWCRKDKPKNGVVFTDPAELEV